MISVFRVSIVVYFIIFIQSHDFCVHFHWFRPFRLMRAITHARISTRANLSVLAIWRMHEKLCSAEKVLFHRIFFFQSFVYVYNRDVRYEKIPVSVYRKKYTGNTGIPVFWPCKKLSFIRFSESWNGRKIPKHWTVDTG